MNLGALLAPISVDAFFAGCWEREPLHVARDRPGYFADVYDIAELEESLVAGARDLERFALVKAGAAQIGLDAYVVTSPAIRWKSTGKAPTPHVDSRKITGLLAHGYTLVIKDAALLSARLQRACNHLQRDLGAFVGANVYLTPAGAQGLDVHHDTHDTLTVQIEGSKTWRIYEPLIELPLESQLLRRNTRPPALKLHDEVTLAAGDTLYLPRGYAHEAVATENRALHVTFALAPVRVIDLLHDTLDAVAAQDVALRRALPRGWQSDPQFAAAFAAEFAPRLTALDAAAVTAAAETSLNDLFAASRNDADGAFEQLERSSNITPDSMLRVNGDLPFLVRERASTIEILLPGTSLAFSKSCMPALERLQGGPVTFAAFAPELTENDRRLFLNALVREGLVLVDNPSG